MSLTYAIADLHGRFDLLERALALIAAHAPPPATLVTLGDYSDRGPQSRQIIERLMAGPEQGWRWVHLKGNHEDIMARALGNPALMNWWLQNGGGETLASYGGEVPIDDVRWIEGLPLFHEDANRVFVHAWVHPTKPLAEQIELRCHHGEPALFWTLYARNDDGGHNGKHVVHGHHQHENGPILKTGRTNLDTFAWYTGRLVIGVFDDNMPGPPIEYIEVIGPPIAE